MAAPLTRLAASTPRRRPSPGQGRRRLLRRSESQGRRWPRAPALTTLAHAFPNTPDNVTLGYGGACPRAGRRPEPGDPAGRETARSTSNAAYAYSPPVASTPYAAANALNQYPSVNSYPYTYWPEGPLKQNDQLQASYNEAGKLVMAYITTTPGVIDPNNWEYMGADPLDHVLWRERQAVAGQSHPFFYLSTDGLRPETVLEWQYVAQHNVYTFQGYRRYVLGPGPDERWAFVDIDNTIYYPHTDRDGTAIALSSASGAAGTKFHYGAYGESSDPATDLGPGPSSYAYRYTGQRLDPNTGLYDFKARDYSPSGGRFLQPDPAGLDQGPNLYLYVGDDPVNVSDPSGMTVRGFVADAIELAANTAEVIGDGLPDGPAAAGPVGEGTEALRGLAEGIRAGEAAASEGSAVYRGSTLARNMAKAGNPVTRGAQQAHHVVAQGAKAAAPARAVLQRVGIGIHSAENGAAVAKGAHQAVHTADNYARVNSAIQAAEKGGADAVKAVLNDLRNIVESN